MDNCSSNSFPEGQAKSEFQAVTDLDEVLLRRIVLDELENGRFIHPTAFIGYSR